MQTITTSKDDWTEARVALLNREKAHMRESDALAEARRALPALHITKDYFFEGPDGTCSLADLFAGQSQLMIYHFMFGPDWTEGCPSCSFWADNIDGIDAHLAARDVSFLMVSSAPLARIEPYKARMGWRMKWFGGATEFNRDMDLRFTAEDVASRTGRYNFADKGFASTEAPGLTCFRRDGDDILLTYAMYSRGIEHFNGAYQLLDLAPKGRDEAKLAHPMAWLRRHDRYQG